MLLTKKTKFSLSEAQIKEDILSDSGDLLLKINIRYPEIKCAKNDPLAKYAKGFYADIASSLAGFARKELVKTAINAYNADKGAFLPYAAVMRYEVTLENNDHLSVLLDISVSDGINRPSVERKTQVWERKNGTKCRYSDFVLKEDITALVPEGMKKRIDFGLFVLRVSGIEFFIPDTSGYIPLPIELKITDKK